MCRQGFELWFTSNTIIQIPFDLSSLTFHWHKAGWHCSQWHAGEHQNQLSCIWRLPVSPLLRWGLCISHCWCWCCHQFLHSQPTLRESPRWSEKGSPEAPKCVSAPSAQGWHGSPSGSWARCCSQGMQMHFGWEHERKGAMGRAGVSASSLPHVSGSWYPQGSSQVSREWSQLHSCLWQQDPFLKGKEKCPALTFSWKYLFSLPQWNKNYMCHTLSQLLSNWAEGSNCPLFFNFGTDFDFIVCFMTTH